MRKDLPESTGAEQPDAEQSDAGQPDDDAGLSRAERRAKARGKNPQQQAHGQPHFQPKNNQAGAKRNYSNRRAG
jgi:hypothetical protein